AAAVDQRNKGCPTPEGVGSALDCLCGERTVSPLHHQLAAGQNMDCTCCSAACCFSAGAEASPGAVGEGQPLWEAFSAGRGGDQACGQQRSIGGREPFPAAGGGTACFYPGNRAFRICGEWS